MKQTQKQMLWTIGAKGVDIVSRGAIVNVLGTECNYVGPSPDGQALFWIEPNHYRSLEGQELQQAGFLLKETVPDKKEF